jgi:hypothetical protein
VWRQIIEEGRLEAGSPEYRKLRYSIQRAEIEALTAAAERDAGDWSGEPKDKLVQPPKAIVYQRREKIVEVLDRYHRKSPSRVGLQRVKRPEGISG